ncbi:c-type cytochrome [Pedobacter sp. BS3]|uniref:PQQ-dependent sugar dehydrogenase n=1 Tax=Pedobacter sp. BS3 TaxID=2567937 RepID=UPI0011EBBF77|nr:PQQ-dependent sugar dehydrogenase [Pedobacter sp. BS3]TZF81429.1 c-type cytochrome [Pedobacter sp. BS3]
MKILLFVLTLWMAWILTTNCTNNKLSNRNNIPVPELTVTLDSTVIGTQTILANLNVPWEITWGPDNWIWFTEQSGTVSKVNPVTGQKKLLLKIPEVYRIRSLGLLGMAIHPDKKLPYIFFDYTYKERTAILSKLVRYTYTADTLINPIVLLKDIPGHTGHNGSRVVIAPDGKIMMSTGYAALTKNSQDSSSLNGKILRINIDGTIPSDNPIPGSPIWTSGHRNPQGLVYTSKGILFSSEHGDAIEDELNIIKKGGNYGWPYVEGYCDQPDEKTYCNIHPITEPIKAWTPVIAPAGIDYYKSSAIPEWQNSILLVTLKTQTFRILKLNTAGNKLVDEKIYFDHKFGRLRDVCISPSGDVYMSTSNRDWNPGEGYPKAGDDKIIRIYKIKTDKKLAKAPSTKKSLPEKAENKQVATTGAVIYSNYCASCHKSDGSGIPGTFPPLKGTAQVLDDKNKLLRILLKGISGTITVKGVQYNQEMPSFKFLSDQDIAQVATYIRSHFGNKAGAVTNADVAKARSEKQ